MNKELITEHETCLLLCDYKDKLRNDTVFTEPVIRVATQVLEECIKNYKETREQEKYNLVKKELPFFTGCRFDNLKQLNDMLSKECGITVEESWSSEENSQTGMDYHLVGAINESWGYVDMYYILDNDKKLYITEVDVSED